MTHVRSTRALTAIACLLVLAGCSRTTPTRKGDTLAAYHPDPLRGQSIYRAFCSQCHDDGEEGAPTLDDPDDWDAGQLAFPSILIDHAEQGYLEMPARGSNTELSEHEVADAVSYMMQQVASERDQVQ